ncbi:MAG: sugar phosphate isomerase/epimerase [Thaumarchaeota archaeon]|nr:MAG: sugar phosphate isomerase/epimerase [Nitrososphaerota archaeon]
MSWKYSITLSSFKNLEPIEKTLENLKYNGFDAVEVYGEPDSIDITRISQILDSLSMAVSGVTGMWSSSNSNSKFRKLVTNDNNALRDVKNYVKKCITLCHFLGGKTFNICLFSDPPLTIDGNHKSLLRDDKRKLISASIDPVRELAQYARNYDVDLLIEPLNRYSTPICTDSEDARYMVEQLYQENVGILLDTFHMNIEEDSIEDAILKTGKMLKHVHVSDNNRKMPGLAHIDFKSIVAALKKINYMKFLTFEPTVQSTDYKNDLKYGLEHLRNLSKIQ